MMAMVVDGDGSGGSNDVAIAIALVPIALPPIASSFRCWRLLMTVMMMMLMKRQ